MTPPAPIISLLWLFSMLAAVLLAAGAREQAPRSAPALATAGVAFSAGLALALWAAPRAETAGVLVAIAAAWATLSRRPVWLGEALAGLLAALAAGLFAASGMAVW